MTTALLDDSLTLGTDPAPADAGTADPALAQPRWLRRSIIGLGVLTGLMLATSAAVAYDRTTDDRLLHGVSIGGIALGGQSEGAVRTRFDSATEEIARRSVSVRSGDTVQTLTLGQLGVRSTVDEALAAARHDRRAMVLPVRMWNRLLRRDVDNSYAVRFDVDPARADAAVQGLAAKVDKPPVDARLDTSTGFVKVIPAAPGRTLDRPAATAALLAHARTVANRDPAPALAAVPLTLETKPVAAAVTNFPQVILVRTGENKLYFYENGEVRKTYTVATGSARYPTPKGTFKVIERRRNPTWINPDPTGWGKNMPRRIGPGRGNPLGTRALRLNSPGINIHGTSNLGSLGHSVSHGCIRMSIRESEELFELIPMNTPVIILQAAPIKAAPPAATTDPLDNPDVPIDLTAG